MTNKYIKIPPTDTIMSIRFHKSKLKKAKKLNLNVAAIARDAVYSEIEKEEKKKK